MRRKMTNLRWIAALALCGLGACEPGEPGSAGLEVESWSVASEPRIFIGAQETVPGHMLEAVVKAFVTDGSLMIADGKASEIRRFGPSGELEWTAGRRGKGPGEFTPWLSHLFRWPGDTIAASDLSRVHLFELDGEFIRTWRIPRAEAPMVFSGGVDGTRVFRAQWRAALPAQDGFTSDSIYLHLYDQADVRFATLGPWVGNHMHYVVGTDTYSASWVPFMPDVQYSIGPDLIWIGHGASRQIRGINGAGETVSQFTLGWPPQPVTAQDLDQLEGEFSFQLPETKPLIGDIVADLAGRVWVQRYHFPGSPEPQDWSVFSSTGEHIADVALPAGLRVLSIGHDWITGRSTDPLGLHRVGVYDVNRSR